MKLIYTLLFLQHVSALIGPSSVKNSCTFFPNYIGTSFRSRNNFQVRFIENNTLEIKIRTHISKEIKHIPSINNGPAIGTPKYKYVTRNKGT
jgi:hypothetical protein